MTKEQKELTDRAIQKIAETQGITVSELKKIAEERILWIMSGGDPELTPYLNMIPHDGFLPTAEELLCFLIEAFPVVIEEEQRKNRQKGLLPQ